MPNKSYKEAISEWALHTTAHGIPSIADTNKNSIRILWTLFLLASTGYCGFVLNSNILEYLSYEVETLVEIVRDNDAYFPAVSFCFLQQCGFTDFDFKKYLNLYYNEEFNKSGKMTQQELNNIIKSKNIQDLMSGAKEAFFKHHDPTDLQRVLNLTSIKKNVISCQFSSDFCNEYDFEPFLLNDFLKCYRFNGGKTMTGSNVSPRNARRYGKSYGLQIELYVGKPEVCKSPLGTDNGLIVYIHNYTNTINEEDTGYLLAPGTETNIAIDRTFIAKKPYPYSECIQNRDRTGQTKEKVLKTFELYTNYTQKRCLNLCYQMYLVEKFNCFDESIPYFDDSKPACGKIASGFNNSIYKDKKEFYNGTYDKCRDECPIECEYMIFDATISSSQFPTTTYTEVLVLNENVSEYFSNAKGDNQFQLVKRSVLSLNVFYKTDLFKKISEKEAITSMMFVSNIGGTLGLFLGISLLSLVEIFQIVCECFSILVDRKIHPEIQKKSVKVHHLIDPALNDNTNSKKNIQNFNGSIHNSIPPNDLSNETETTNNSTANLVANSSYA